MLHRMCLLVVVSIIISISTLAQSQANTGNIEGRVTDPNAAAVPNVTVTATNLATGLQRMPVTNDEGIYRIVFLPPGNTKLRRAARRDSRRRLSRTSS